MQRIIIAFLLASLISTISVNFDLQESQINFNSSFCGNCSSCTYNADQVNVLEAGYYKLNAIINNTYNISKVIVKIGQISSSYEFPSKTIKMDMKYVLALPSTPKIRGVILYNHPNVFGKLNVPSNLGKQIYALIGFYTTQQFAIVIPDYLGCDLNSTYPHPYILNAAQNIDASIQVLNLVSIELNIYGPERKRLFVIGYSQGGLFAVNFQFCSWRASCKYQNTPLSTLYFLIAVIGLEGPYGLISVIKPFLFEDVGPHYRHNPYQVQTQLEATFAKPPLFAFTLLSFLQYSDFSGSLSQYLQSQFFKMNCTYPINQEKCKSIYPSDKPININTALVSYLPSQQIALSISYSALGKEMNSKTYTTSELLKLEFSHTNSITSLVNTTKFMDKLDQALIKSSLVGKRATVKTFVFSLYKDSVVPINNTILFAENNPQVSTKFFDNTRHQVCKQGIIVNVDHEGGQLLANIFALHYLNQL